jgi:hypothetical protein
MFVFNRKNSADNRQVSAKPHEMAGEAKKQRCDFLAEGMVAEDGLYLPERRFFIIVFLPEEGKQTKV